MADLASVEQGFVSTLAQIIYPHGTGSPSIAGVDCRIRRGWPIPANLDADLAAGKLNVTVFAQDNERNVTRYPREWQVLADPVVNLTLTASGTTITASGTPSSPLNAAANVNGRAYVYPVQPGDTLAMVATGLATLINADTPATSSGPVVTIPGASRLSALVGGVGTMIRELKRQKRGFILTFWCPDPDTRDAIVAPVDAALAATDYLSLPDGTEARLIYEKTRSLDQVEREGLYRRDLFYSAEYATTDGQAAYQIVEIVLNLTDWAGNPIPPAQAGTNPPQGGNALLLEGGGYLLTEDGNRILLES